MDLNLLKYKYLHADRGRVVRKHLLCCYVIPVSMIAMKSSKKEWARGGMLGGSVGREWLKVHKILFRSKNRSVVMGRNFSATLNEGGREKFISLISVGFFRF